MVPNVQSAFVPHIETFLIKEPFIDGILKDNREEGTFSAREAFEISIYHMTLCCVNLKWRQQTLVNTHIYKLSAIILAGICIIINYQA